jgi:hypothetical protein
MDRHSRYRSLSMYRSSSQPEEFSIRKDSPSPPDLTDGTSRAETPLSADVRSNLTVLSESNHRLSHVAETGQLAPRTRQPKQADALSTHSLDRPHSHRQIVNFSVPRAKALSGSMSYSSTRLSSRTSSFHAINQPGYSTGEDFSRLYSPRPLLTMDFDKMARRSMMSDPKSMLPNVKPPSNALLHPYYGQHLSPILAEYLSGDHHRRYFTLSSVSARHRVETASLVESVASAPEPLFAGDFRKVNSSFEVSKRGTMGSLAIPLDLPPLELPSLEVHEKKEKRKSRKLQKKARLGELRSKSVPARRERISLRG